MTKGRFAPLLWLAYVIVPVEGWGLFYGRPLNGLGALALAALCWLWWVRRSLPFASLAVAALAAKIALGGTLLAPRGFEARYYANAEFAGAPEAGTEPSDRSFTRTDARLRFAPEDVDLPVYFFNDSSRFNFYLPAEPDRSTLPVSVVWEGWLRITRAGMQRLYVRTAGARVVMAAGDDFSTTIPASTTEWVGYANLKAGFQRIRISLSIPQGAARRFEAGRTVDGREEAFDTGVVFRRPITATALAADWLLRAISTAFDLMVCGWLAVGVLGGLGAAWRRLTIGPAAADALAIVWAAALVDAFLFARPALRKMATLSGGNDWLTYETMARDIGLHGLWMTGGAAIGHGHAFHYQPLYSYFVAATHWLFGGDLYGLYLLQRLLAAGTAIALWRLTAALFGEPVGWAGLLAGLVIAYETVGSWSSAVLSELLFVPLVCLWALLLVRLAKSAAPSLWSAAAAGAVGGLATLTRSTLMLGWVLALPLVAFSLAGTKRAGRTLVVLAVSVIAVTSLATVRNWVVAREFVLVASSGSINLLLGNAPPGPIVVPDGRRAGYARLGFDSNTQIVAEYARQLPRAFFDGWRKKAAYALGSFGTLTPGAGRSTFYMGLSLVAAIGVLLLVARPPWLRGAGPASLIPLSLALAHFAALVIIFPNVYGDRLVLPFYGLLVPYVGIAAFGAHRALWRLAGPRTGVGVWLALFALCAWQFMGGALPIDVTVVTAAVLVWSLCAYGVPRLPAPVAAVYSAAAIGLCIWAAVRGTAGAEQAARLDGLFVAAAVCSTAIVAGISARRVSERPAFAWLAACLAALTLSALHASAAAATVMTMAGLAVGAVGLLLVRVAGGDIQPPEGERMRGKSTLLVLNLSLVLCVAGCASSPPGGDMDLARASLKKAVEAGAGSFAVESLQAAERAQAALDAEMTAQQGKWFKSYDKARDLAIAAQAAGDKAVADATAAKEEAMAEATAATGDAQRGPNLFRNGDFTDGLQGWAGSPDSDATVSIEVSGPNERTWHAQYRKGNWSVIYQQLTLRPDTVYVYEAMLKSTAPVVALYWQTEVGRFLETDKAYPEWTHLRYVLLTPHWTGQPYLTSFDPVLMKGPGDVWIRNLRLSQFKARGSQAH